MKKETIKSRIEAQLKKYEDLNEAVSMIEKAPLNRELAVISISESANLIKDITALEKETENLFKDLAQRGRIARIGQLREREITLRLRLWDKIEDLTSLQKSLAKRQLAKWQRKFGEGILN